LKNGGLLICKFFHSEADMLLKPEIGHKGGQEFPIVRSIQTFLGQMAEGGAQPGTAVLKELLQNADDAGATELSVVLDERTPPASFSNQFEQLLSPALIVRNNAPFRKEGETLEGKQDDFNAIRDVASGHKRADSTAAGRFGIGFNSVYFLTDTPIIFSRREINIFDLLHKVFEDNGWIFDLSDFPANSISSAGEIKSLIEWCFPKYALQTSSIGEIAANDDYQQAAFRLPFRIDVVGKEYLFNESFSHRAAREKILFDMISEAKRSILFLKSVTKISFYVIDDNIRQTIAQTEVNPNPTKFMDLLQAIKNKNYMEKPIDFERVITNLKHGDKTETYRFHIWHFIYTRDLELSELRKRLESSDRAVPWVSIAVPLDRESSQIDGGENAKWRVFLPLLESGPSLCIFSGAFFVGPSRQRMEYRIDEGILKTEWNQLLVKKGLVDAFSNHITEQLPTIASDLLEKDPKIYLALFPIKPKFVNDRPSNLTEYFYTCFSKTDWWLTIKDIWGDEIQLIVSASPSVTETKLEMIPEWLIEYKRFFKRLSDENRRFISFALGDAIRERLADNSWIKRDISSEIAECVLKAAEPPKLKDLTELLNRILRTEKPLEILDGAWAFINSSDGSVIRFNKDTLYIIDSQKNRVPVIDHLRSLGLPFENVKWVKEDGLAKNFKKIDSSISNIMMPDSDAAIELMRRLPGENRHDILDKSSQVTPIIDFLTNQEPVRLSGLRLGFLVRTAYQKESRRKLGVIFLKAFQPSKDNEALWEVWFRKLFAEVDPGFAKEIHRLLEKQPYCLQMLNALDCEVVEAKSDTAMDVLHRSLGKKPELIDSLYEEINEKNNISKGFSERVSRLIIEYADTNWEEMDDGQKHTFMHLPIHRTSDEKFVSLIDGTDYAIDQYQEHFRLQTEDDLKDAPIELASYVLLQCRDRHTKSFYRNRLKIEVHGRVAVLKGILKQIGTIDDYARNDKLLNYLLDYYTKTVNELRESKDQIDNAEAEYLNTQLSKANFVPCIDGSWHNFSKCRRISRIRERLEEQKWPDKEIQKLIQKLFNGEHIVRFNDSDVINLFLKQQNIEINEIPTLSLYERAISSNSPDLSLKERVRLINDNMSDQPDVGIRPSPILQTMLIPTLTGEGKMGQAEHINSIPFALSALKVVVPKAIDKKEFARQMGLLERQVFGVLRSLCVNEVTSDELDNRVVNKFPELWEASKTKEDRFSVLRYIKSKQLHTKMHTLISTLDVVLSENESKGWKTPSSVFSPSLMLTEPPLLNDEEKPNLSAPEEIKELWDIVCGIRIKSTALKLLVRKVEGLNKSQKAVGDLYSWIDRAISSLDSDQENDLKEALRVTEWVFAEKDIIKKLCLPGDALIHKGNEILKRRFWVPTKPLPAKIKGYEKDFGFQTELEVSKENLEAVCDCLSHIMEPDLGSLLSIYQYIVDAIEENPELNNTWNNLSQNTMVFATYRKEPRLISAKQLFLGDAGSEDLSSSLLCLGAAGEAVPKKAPKLYEALGIPKQATLRQVLHALSEFNERDTANEYKNLVDTVVKFVPNETNNHNFERIKVKACDGSYQPLGQSYWDTALGHKSHVQQSGAQKLIDTRSSDVKNLVNWIFSYDESYPKCLRSHHEAEFTGEQKAATEQNALDYILDPWRNLCDEVMRVDSTANAAIIEMGLNVPHKPIKFKIVEKIVLRYQISNTTIIEQAPKWEGPLAFADYDGNVLINYTHFSKETYLDAKLINEVDETIAEEVLHCLGDVSFYKAEKSNIECLLGLLERPTTVLQNLKQRNRSHFIYQYQDQVADPEFAIIFDEYRKTRPGSSRHQDLEDKLYEMLSGRFVNARREQIKGYGYDDFSVITELLQNAEDAYVQRAWLGMEMPDKCEVVFRYENEENKKTVLNIEHEGRPFNYYRHEGKEDPAFARDVEGVLRSAGSYKPHSRIGDERGDEADCNIGRFGLGFKSVFLLTDRPEIHSGHWHFAIENGCIPVEEGVPDNWNASLTRIRLPLNSSTGEYPDANRLAQLLPFLRKIKSIRIVDIHGNEDIVRLKEMPEDEGCSVKECTVEISGQSSCRFIKVSNGTAQMAMLIDSKGFPTNWSNFFSNDFYIALPLKSHLGCGVGISNNFKVQSGRTHLTSSEENEQFARDVAGLLVGLTKTLEINSSGQGKKGVSTFFMRFWQIWDWNGYDAKCKFIIDRIAEELWRLIYTEKIIPTYEENIAVCLEDNRCFYFVDIPSPLREALLENGFSITSERKSVQLSDTNVVPEGFVSNLRRLAEYTGNQIEDTLFRLSWEEISLECETRPWLAEKPKLLNTLASCLTEDRMEGIGRWVAKCKVSGINSEGQKGHWLPHEMYIGDIVDGELLPKRFLLFIDQAYDDVALKLLKKSGLKNAPFIEDISTWITKKQLNKEECLALLQYLAKDDRFRYYWDLKRLLQSPWIECNGYRVTPKEANEKGILQDNIVDNKPFAAWLGLDTINNEPIEPSKITHDTEFILGKLADWWMKNSHEQLRRYNGRVYPNGQTPSLVFSDGIMTTSERREWMIMLILGSLHNMGRQNPEQHRGFLERCSRGKWLDVISECNVDCQRWFDFIESFIDDPLGNQDYYHWMKQIIAFYQFNRWLPAYVDVFKNIDRFNHVLTTVDIVDPRRNPDFSGGGPDAPSMRRAIGRVGIHFVLRELVRLKFIEGENIHHLCYVPVQRVRELLAEISNGERIETSEDIYQLLVKHMGYENATFGGVFDLPLMILADDRDLRQEII